MTLCMHVATKDALIVCSDSRSCLTNKYRDGSVEFVKFLNDEVKSFFYNDIVISISGFSIYRIVSGLSSTGECHIYRVFGEHGEILELSDVQNYSSVGVKFLANSILSRLIIPELSTKSVLEIFKFIAKTYCNYSELVFDEMFDSKYSEDYMHIDGVGGKWIFYVLDFKTKKGKYVKFCADGKFRYYSKLVRNKFD